MPRAARQTLYTYTHGVRPKRFGRCLNRGGRPYSESERHPVTTSDAQHNEQDAQMRRSVGTMEEGAMTRRLSEMTEKNLEEGGRSAQKAIGEAGFDVELKRKLQERIANATFRDQHPSAFSEVNMPSSAGRGTREQAAARPWTGVEMLEDSALRMLNDAFKPIRTPAKIPGIRGPPSKVDAGRPKDAPSTGARLANARDRSSAYAYLKDESISEQQREQFRKELKDRFAPGARPMPTTLQGLASLANERIEDAIARGQFKNLPRGKKLERDHNMSSPFLDTTEYFLNKIIQKQEIVPPWIEKQQEVVSTATKFRSRLRTEWRRHAARLIASQGGTLQAQLRKAEHYAAAEAIVNPPKNKVEKVNAVDNQGHLSQITLASDFKHAKPGDGGDADVEITVDEQTVSPVVDNTNSEKFDGGITVHSEANRSADNENPKISAGVVFPFRDRKWEEIERAYHVAAIDNLNTITRSYNLMAPKIAQRPYFSLDRELKSCFADVAPQLADEIQQRAIAPKVKVNVVGHRPGTVLERLTGDKAKVYDEKRPQYGFKEFWKDLFGSKEST